MKALLLVLAMSVSVPGFAQWNPDLQQKLKLISNTAYPDTSVENNGCPGCLRELSYTDGTDTLWLNIFTTSSVGDAAFDKNNGTWYFWIKKGDKSTSEDLQSLQVYTDTLPRCINCTAMYVSDGPWETVPYKKRGLVVLTDYPSGTEAFLFDRKINMEGRKNPQKLMILSVK